MASLDDRMKAYEGTLSSEEFAVHALVVAELLSSRIVFQVRQLQRGSTDPGLEIVRRLGEQIHYYVFDAIRAMRPGEYVQLLHSTIELMQGVKWANLEAADELIHRAVQDFDCKGLSEWTTGNIRTSYRGWRGAGFTRWALDPTKGWAIQRLRRLHLR